MFADLYNPDVFFSYQSMGMEQLVGAAADIVNVLMVVFVVAISLTFVTPDMQPRARLDMPRWALALEWPEARIWDPC